MVKRFDVYMVSLDPSQGTEIKKARPCLIISPNDMNNTLSTVIIAPMTTKLRNYPSRVRTTFQNKVCDIILDQIRAVDKTRLSKKLGTINHLSALKVLSILKEIFSE